MLPGSWKYGTKVLSGWKRAQASKPVSLCSSLNKPLNTLKEVLKSPKPSNSLVLKCAKQVRGEYRRILPLITKEESLFAPLNNLRHGITSMSHTGNNRNNLSLYTRMIRLQAAAYHATSGPKSSNLNESFEFKPPVRRTNRHSAFARSNSSTCNDPSHNHTHHHSTGASHEHTGLGSSSSSSSSSWFSFGSKSNKSSSDATSSPSGSSTATMDKPFPVFVVPGRWSWLSPLVSVLFLVVLIIWIYNGTSGSSSPLSNLLGNSFEVAMPSELSFDDVKGNLEAKEELSDIVAYLKDPDTYAAQGIKVPKGVLLTGPPGTGKTMLARAMASESGVPFISTSGSEFEEMLVGVGARRVRQLFQLAKTKAPCIVFIDEIDAVGARRDDVHNSHNRMSMNQMLVEMDGFNPKEGIVVVAATNWSDILDPALVRPGRFDRKVGLELPDPTARKQILDHYLKNKKLDTDVNTGILAGVTPGFSGADLETMVNWAVILGSKKKSAITMRMLEEAMFNVAMGREKKSLVLNDETKRLCAYHESGHALVALLTPGSSEIRRATLVPRGDALGMVNFMANEQPMTTHKELLARMDVAMGGRASEELIYGLANVTTGASSDFQQATKVASVMVMQLGLSPRLGPVHLSKEKGNTISPETQLVVEQEVQRLVNESYTRASKLLKDHQKELHLLAQALLKYESLSVDEIKRAVSGDPLVDKEAELAAIQAKDKVLAEEEAAARAKRKAAIAAQRAAAAAAAQPDKEKVQVKVNLASSKE